MVISKSFPFGKAEEKVGLAESMDKENLFSDFKLYLPSLVLKDRNSD